MIGVSDIGIAVSEHFSRLTNSAKMAYSSFQDYSQNIRIVIYAASGDLGYNSLIEDIYRFKPDIFFVEGIVSRQKSQEISAKFKHATLEDIAQENGISLSDSGISDFYQNYPAHLANMLSIDSTFVKSGYTGNGLIFEANTLPRTFSEYVKTPIFEFSPLHFNLLFEYADKNTPQFKRFKTQVRSFFKDALNHASKHLFRIYRCLSTQEIPILGCNLRNVRRLSPLGILHREKAIGDSLVDSLRSLDTSKRIMALFDESYLASDSQIFNILRLNYINFRLNTKKTVSRFNFNQE